MSSEQVIEVQLLSEALRNMWFVYIVKCTDNSLYTGFTNDLERRIKEHNGGSGAKSLRGKKPVKLVYSETFKESGEARRREYAIKQWTRGRKLKLIYGAASSTGRAVPS